MIEANPQKPEIDLAVSELKHLKSGAPMNWGRLARLLELVDRHELWRESNSSFTAWITSTAERIGVKRATLWRYLSSGRSYVQMREKFPTSAQTPLEDLGQEISPENLELLSKLHRVAPNDTFTDLALKTLSGNITRSTLRNAWQSFSAILDGKTARGRSHDKLASVTIDFNAHDHKSVRAYILSQLSTSNGSWCSFSKLSTVKFFMDESILKCARADLVMVTKGGNSRLLTHGIRVVVDMQNLAIDLNSALLAMNQNCDLTWLAFPAMPSQELINTLPSDLGILVVDSNGINTVKISPVPALAAKNTSQLVLKILEKTLAG